MGNSHDRDEDKGPLPSPGTRRDQSGGRSYGFRDDWREGVVSRAIGLPRLFVDRALANVTSLHFTRSVATDATLAQVARFPRLDFFASSTRL